MLYKIYEKNTTNLLHEGYSTSKKEILEAYENMLKKEIKRSKALKKKDLKAQEEREIEEKKKQEYIDKAIETLVPEASEAIKVPKKRWYKLAEEPKDREEKREVITEIVERYAEDNISNHELTHTIITQIVNKLNSEISAYLPISVGNSYSPYLSRTDWFGYPVYETEENERKLNAEKYVIEIEDRDTLK